MADKNSQVYIIIGLIKIYISYVIPMIYIPNVAVTPIDLGYIQWYSQKSEGAQLLPITVPWHLSNIFRKFVFPSVLNPLISLPSQQDKSLYISGMGKQSWIIFHRAAYENPVMWSLLQLEAIP